MNRKELKLRNQTFEAIKPMVWLVDCDRNNDNDYEDDDEFDTNGGAVCIHPNGILLGVHHVVPECAHRLRARRSDEQGWREGVKYLKKKSQERSYVIKEFPSLDLSLFAVERQDGEQFPYVDIENVKVRDLLVSEIVWLFGHRDLIPFSWLEGKVAYPLPKDVSIEIPAADVGFMKTDFHSRGYPQPYRKARHITDTRPPKKGKKASEDSEDIEDEEDSEDIEDRDDGDDKGDGEHKKDKVSYPDFAAHLYPDLPLIEIHALAGEEGCSGCPLWGLRGQLLGICSFLGTEAAYAIPIQVLKIFYGVHFDRFLRKVNLIMKTSRDTSPKVDKSKKKRKKRKDDDEPKDEQRGNLADKSKKKRKKRKDDDEPKDEQRDSYKRQPSNVRHDPRSKFEDHKENRHVDIHTKRAALKASACVVSITSSPSDMAQGKDVKDGLSRASGFIVECEEINAGYLITMLTTASLLRCPHVQPADFELNVHLFNGESYKGHVLAFDFHYNLAMIRIQSESSLPVGILRHVDDSISIDPSVPLSSQGFQLRHHSELYTLIPGDKITALGRYFEHPYDLMIAPGVFSAGGLRLNCDELRRANCRITKSGVGGPLLNYHGEVIGINFYGHSCTPFLPSNIVSKWVDHFKSYRDFRRPLLGMRVTNLYVARGEFLEKILHKFHGTEKGAYVEKVAKGSPAFEAGIHEDDVIIQCGGKVIQSALQLYEATFDMAGKSTHLVVKRASSDAELNLTLVVGETEPNKFNRWPLPPRVRIVFSSGGTRGC